MTDSLEKCVIAALALDFLPSADLQTLILQMNAAISEAENAAATARESAFDPTRSSDLQAAQREMENTALRLGRLQTLAPRLQSKYQESLAAETHARWLADYESVKAQRDDLAAEFRQCYPALVNELAGLFAEMKRIDGECERVNSAASGIRNEHRRLLGCELAARGLENFSASAPSILQHQDRGLRLPDFPDSSALAWPPPRPSLAPEYFGVGGIAPTGDPRRYSADWAVAISDDNARRAKNEERWDEAEARQQAESKRRYEDSLPR